MNSKYENLNETKNLIQETIQDLEIVVTQYKKIKSRFFENFILKTSLFEKAVENKDGTEELILLQLESSAAKKAFDASDKDYNDSLNYKLNLQKSLDSLNEMQANLFKSNPSENN